MKDSMKQSNLVDKAGAAWSEVRKAAFVAMFALLPASAWAQDAIGENGAVCKFFSNINNILNIASIAVVTIAVIFAGYQIAFAHKRISDVAPVLIGGLLIGGAAQFAKMLMPNQSDQCLGDLAMLLPALQPVYAYERPVQGLHPPGTDPGGALRHLRVRRGRGLPPAGVRGLL